MIIIFYWVVDPLVHLNDELLIGVILLHVIVEN